MARLTKKQLDKLKKKFNVDIIWSFSRVNCFKNCTYEFYLRYIKKVKQVDTNIYSVLGGNFHDSLQDYYEGNIKYEEVEERWGESKLQVELAEMKFNNNDDDQNEKTANKYYKCIDHYVKNFNPIESHNGKVAAEKDIKIKVGNHLFIGYVDMIHVEKDENGEEIYVITDFKTSTIYTGKKILKEGKQLLLYALGLHQMGIPLSNLRIQWDFGKYLDVTFQQANGKYKTTHAERHTWVGKIKNQIRRDMKKQTDLDEDTINEMLNVSTETNSIANLPDKIQDLYKIDNCYIEIPVNEEEIEILVEDLKENIKEIYRRTAEFEKTGDESIWEREVTDRESFYCSNLCGYTPNECICYKTYLEHRDMFKDKEEEEEADSSWMDELGLE